MSVLDLLLGKPLATSAEDGERVGPAAGIPIFGLDALSSAAYGPEAALTLLISVGALGVAYIVPITGAIILLLTIVYFSYRQTKMCIRDRINLQSATVESRAIRKFKGVL